MQNEPEKQKKESFELSQKIEQEQGEAQISPEKLEQAEEREIKGEREENVRERLEQEAEKMPLTAQATKDLKSQAGAVSVASNQGKVQRLLQIAQEKGLLFAVKVAKETGDPYAMDLLHDALAKDNLYKQYLKDNL